MPGPEALLPLLAAPALIALALLTLGPWRLPDGRVPPSLMQELERRQLDLSHLAASAGARSTSAFPTGRVAAASALGCAELNGAVGVSLAGSGITKLVLRAALSPSGEEIALKSVHWAGSDVNRCVQRYGHLEGCYRLASYKLLKETVLLQSLDHPGVVKACKLCNTILSMVIWKQFLLSSVDFLPSQLKRSQKIGKHSRSLDLFHQLRGQCYERSLAFEMRVVTMLELGTPLEMIRLLQTPWEERFKICLDLVELLCYLAHSPLGSIALLDFQPRQFVMVNGILKVTDLDDVSTEELSCRGNEDCTLEFPTKSFIFPCGTHGKCEGMNEKRNLFNAYRYFFMYLLPHLAPVTLQPILADILNATGDLRYGAKETRRAFQKVLYLYKSGLYLQKKPSPLKEYIALKGFHNSDTEDYKCWPSYSHLGCVISVHNTEEAAAICSSHPQCQHFIITPERTWTGRPLALFRSNFTELIPGGNMVVYVKRAAASRGSLRQGA